MTFSDSDWTRDPPRPALLPPAQRRVLLAAVAIALGVVAIALAMYGIEQWQTPDGKGMTDKLGTSTGRLQPLEMV